MSLIDKTTVIVAKFTDLIYLRALRDGVSATVPFFFAASIAILLSYIISPLVLPDNALVIAQKIADVIKQGSLGIMGLLITPAVAFALAKHRRFENSLSVVLISISIFFVLIPLNTVLKLNDSLPIESLRLVDIGTPSMLVSILIGLLSADLYMLLVKKNVTLNFGSNVPPQVANSIVGLIPYILTLFIFAIGAIIIDWLFEEHLFTLFFNYIQKPIQAINTSLWGYAFIYSIGSLLFSVGIHQTGINGVLLDPLLLLNMNENIQLVANGELPTHIITNSFQIMYSQIGGSGGTLSLLIAIFIFSRYQPSRDVAKVSLMPGIFAINEPIIFGFPIVFNPVMIIPFILVPAISTTIAYYATLFNFVSKTVVMIPWTTPPLVSGYLATAGDIRSVILQLLLIILGVFIYLPFMKFSERVARINNQSQA